MEMFRFGNIEYLWGLLIIPLLVVFFVWSRISRRRALKKFGQQEILGQLMPYSSGTRPVVKFIILMLALAFFIVGIARPQFGSKLKTEKREGVELMIALD
ncbi:BatA domain-containing protein, partial [Draconibacterium sp.]|uniref:BatA domain-containing protein n=1 Tax=Draconibacterium sp. TaxID=1965318 RepID=UPI003568D7FC